MIPSPHAARLDAVRRRGCGRTCERPQSSSHRGGNCLSWRRLAADCAGIQELLARRDRQHGDRAHAGQQLLVMGMAQRRQHGAVLRHAAAVVTVRHGRGDRANAVGAARDRESANYVSAGRALIRAQNRNTGGALTRVEHVLRCLFAGGSRLQLAATGRYRLDLSVRTID